MANVHIEQFLASTQLYDVSMTIRPGMPVWRNYEHKQPEFENTANYSTGHSYETRLHLDAHTGTHLDAPLHMVESGLTIETTTLDQVVRPARVVDLTEVEDAIHADDVARVKPQKGEFLLLKTRNSAVEGWDDNFVFVADDGAKAFVEAGITGVGIDSLGIERSQPSHATHTQLLGAGIVILEGLRLADVPVGDYLMIAAPLKFEGIEAGLARVLLFG